eukprot:13949060-Ditylum_brightwellii.AAC.1
METLPGGGTWLEGLDMGAGGCWCSSQFAGGWGQYWALPKWHMVAVCPASTEWHTAQQLQADGI